VFVERTLKPSDRNSLSFSLPNYYLCPSSSPSFCCKGGTIPPSNLGIDCLSSGAQSFLFFQKTSFLVKLLSFFLSQFLGFMFSMLTMLRLKSFENFLR
jgi:hypothetical protein